MKNPIKLSTVLLRGVKKRCPKCGQSRIFKKWLEIEGSCAVCGCHLKARDNDTWFFTYVSIAGTTGIFVILMFFIVPTNQLLGKIVVGLLSLAVFVTTDETRKSIGIALDYFVDSRLEHPKYRD